MRKQIEALIAGTLVLAPSVDGTFLVPANAEGDFELVLGQDASVGFEQQVDQRVRLYLTESFTFRVLDPQAVIVFNLAPPRSVPSRRGEGAACSTISMH